jgi:hypothetical protein
LLARRDDALLGIAVCRGSAQEEVKNGFR